MTRIAPRGRGRWQIAAAAGVIMAMATAVPAAAQQHAAGPAAPGPAAPGPAVTATGWPQFQRNAAHTGSEPGEKSLTGQNVSQLQLAWTDDLPDPSNFADVVETGGVAYAITETTLTAFNAADGSPRWQASFPGILSGSPAVQGSLVVVGMNVIGRPDRRGVIEALDTATGAMVWRTTVIKAPHGELGESLSMTTTGNRVYATLNNRTVIALGLSHGGKIWQSPVVAAEGCGLSQPSVADGFVVVGDGGHLSALHASDGTVAWADTLGGGCGGTAAPWLPAISQGTVYAGLLDGVAAVDLATGTVLWHNTSVPGVSFTMSLTGDEVIGAPDSGKQLAALNRSDGTVTWRISFPPGVAQIGGPAVFGGLAWAVYSPNTGGSELLAFNSATGHRVYHSLAFNSVQLYPPVVDAGRIYWDLGNDLLAFALPGAR